MSGSDLDKNALEILQQDNRPCHKSQIKSHCFLGHDRKFTVLKWPPQSPDLNSIKQLWDMMEWEILIMKMQELCDAFMSAGSKYLRNLFSTLFNLCHK